MEENKEVCTKTKENTMLVSDFYELMNNFEFLTKIAEGFNPITGEAFNENDILCKPEISKRLLDLIQTLQEAV